MKTLRWMSVVVCALAAVTLALALVAAAQAAPLAPQANTYIVNGTADSTSNCISGGIGGYSCPSLRSAIIAANANPGSTIRLTHDVTYTLSITKDITDGATTGDLNIIADTSFDFVAEACYPHCAATIQGSAGWDDRLLNIASGAHVSLFLITFRNGNVVGYGGGISNNGTLTLTSSTILSNTANNGGGIYNTSNGSLNLNDTIVSHNTSSQDGGGFYVDSGALTLINSQVSDNRANYGYGGGIFAKTRDTTLYATLSNTLITTNTAEGGGGGIGVLSQSTVAGHTYLTITGGTLEANTTSNFGGTGTYDGGGGMLYYLSSCTTACSTNLTISGTQIVNNQSYVFGAGGGIEFINEELGTPIPFNGLILNSVIGHNRAETGWGGGISDDGLPLSIVNTQIISNMALYAGGGLYNVDGDVAITVSDVVSNVTGGIYNDLDYGGGGVYNAGNLTLDHVNISANAILTGSAGGLLNSTTATATLHASNVSANSAVTSTGGIENHGVMALDHTTISGNTAKYVGGVLNVGTLTILGGEISSNTVTDDNAGLYNAGTLNAAGLVIGNNQSLTGYGCGLSNEGVAGLTDTQIISNAAPFGLGAGVMNDGPVAHLTLSHATIMSNTAATASGIYNNQGTITLTASTLAHNVATSGSGGGLLNATYTYGGSPLYGSLQMDGSAVFDNRATDQGGGIYNSHIITITNSTISGNYAGDSGGGLLNNTSPYDLNPTAYLNNVTIANNQADSNNDGAGEGGGVAVISGTLLIRNTLIGANTDLSNQAPDCSGTLTSDRYNLVQNMTTSCTLVGNLVGNITGQNPLLGPLHNNGGSTWTQALLDGSPAINAGNPTPPGSGLAACLPTDQRGVIRPVGAACDIGAYEAGGSPFQVYLPIVIR